MAVVYICGWECGDTLLKHTVTGTISVSTSTVRTGQRSLRANNASVSSYAQHFLNAAHATTVMRYYVRWAALPAAAGSDHPILLGIVAAGTQPRLTLTSAGALKFGFGATQNTHPTTIVTGQWYCMDLRVLNNDGTGTKKFDLQVDGVAGTQRTLSEAGSNITAWRWGGPGMTTTQDSFVDDAIINDDSAAYPIGPGQVDALYPTSDGTHSFTAGDFGDNAGTVLSSATTLWQKVDDSPMPLAGAALSAADWLEQIVNRTTGYLEFQFTPTAITGNPRGVAPVYTHQAETAATTTSEIRLNDNGTVETGTTIGGTIAVTTIGHGYKVVAVRPSTSTAWTVASMSTLRARWGYSSDAAPDHRLESILLEIDHTPNTTYTPTTLVLTTATFAPTISVSDNQLVTPTTRSLALATFIPVVTATNHQLVTPSTASLTATKYAPVIRETVTPSVAALALSAFAPSVAISDHQLVTPSTASLSVSAFAPTVSTTAHQTVTPDTASLTVSVFAPTVTASDHQLVTPGAVSLSTAAFAPTVTATDHQAVIPGVAVLSISAFAPTVTANQGFTVTPDVAALSLATFAPSVSATDHQTVTSSTAALSTAAFAPTVTATNHQTVTPSTAVLAVSRFAPTVTATAHKVAIPTTRALTLTSFAPTVSATAHQFVTPDTASLSLTAFEPSILPGFALIPDTAVLALATLVPDVLATEGQFPEPLPATLVLTGLTPVITGNPPFWAIYGGVSSATASASITSPSGSATITTSEASSTIASTGDIVGEVVEV